jgi:biotin transport system substrate-specific component
MRRFSSADSFHKPRNGERSGTREWAKQAAIVIAASLFVALCARVSVPLPFTPVPLTLQNFGVLSRGLAPRLASRFCGACALSARRRVPDCRYSAPHGSRLRNCRILRPDRRISLGLSAGGIRRGLDLRASSKKLAAFRWAAVSAVAAELVLFASGLGLAGRAHALSFAGAQVWPVLVCFCGSDQGTDGRWRRRSLAFAQQHSIL